MKIAINVSIGDYVDRHSILVIKQEKGLNVKDEIEQYQELDEINYNYFLNIIKAINLQLWDLEDRKRKKVERYTSEESDVAYLITMLNDLRHETKKRIDMFYNSDLTERKSH